MISFSMLFAFGVVSFLMVCTPGPNMIYLISRSITQGRKAGIISLFGVLFGFVFYIVATMLGLTALFFAVPLLYEIVKWLGAAYLLWLAWKALKPSEGLFLQSQMISEEKPKKLFMMGFLTNLLNPKIAILYVSLLPQFIDPARGSIITQGAIFGVTQILISFSVNILIVFTASKLADWFGNHSTWLRVQRWFMASVLSGLAIRILLERRQLS